MLLRDVVVPWPRASFAGFSPNSRPSASTPIIDFSINRKTNSWPRGSFGVLGPWARLRGPLVAFPLYSLPLGQTISPTLSKSWTTFPNLEFRTQTVVRMFLLESPARAFGQEACPWFDLGYEPMDLTQYSALSR